METDTRLVSHGTESQDLYSESSEPESFNNSRDPDYYPSRVGEPGSDDDIAQGAAAINQSQQLSRTEIRRATLEYQELPPRRHSKRKRDPLVLKLPSAQLRNLVDEQHPTTPPPESTIHLRGADPDTMVVMPHALPSNPVSSTSDAATASPLPEPKISEGIYSVDWQDELFQAMHGRDLDPASESELEKSYTQIYTLEWYVANDPLLSQVEEPKWGEIAQALGIWNQDAVCHGMLERISKLNVRHKKRWQPLYTEHACRDYSSLDSKQQEEFLRFLEDATNELDTAFAPTILKARPNCTRAYRMSCWQLCMIASISLNKKRLTQARNKVSFPLPEKPVGHQDSKQQTPKVPASVFDRLKSPKARKGQVPFQSPTTTEMNENSIKELQRSGSASPTSEKASKSVGREIAMQLERSGSPSSTFEEVLKSAGGEIASRKHKHDSPKPLPKRSDQMLDKLRRSREVEPAENQHLGKNELSAAPSNVGQPSAAHTFARRGPEAMAGPDKGDLKTTSAVTTRPSDSVPTVGQKRQQDQIEPGFQGARSPDKRAKPNGDFSRSSQRSQSTASKRAIEIKQKHGPVHFKLKADQAAAPLHTTTSMRKKDFEITFDKLQNEYDGRIIRMRVSVPMPSEGIAPDLNPKSIELEPRPSKEALKMFLGQPALQANLEDERIFLVEPVGIKSYLDDLSDDDGDDDEDAAMSVSEDET